MLNFIVNGYLPETVGNDLERQRGILSHPIRPFRRTAWFLFYPQTYAVSLSHPCAE